MLKALKNAFKSTIMERLINIIYISNRYMEDLLLHIRVSKKIKEQMQVLIEAGYFNNQAEVVREGIRNTIIRYKEELPHIDFERQKRR